MPSVNPEISKRRQSVPFTVLDSISTNIRSQRSESAAWLRVLSKRERRTEISKGAGAVLGLFGADNLG